MYNKLSTSHQTRGDKCYHDDVIIGNHCYIYHELNWTLVEESHCSTGSEGHVNVNGFVICCRAVTGKDFHCDTVYSCIAS